MRNATGAGKHSPLRFAPHGRHAILKRNRTRCTRRCNAPTVTIWPRLSGRAGQTRVREGPKEEEVGIIGLLVTIVVIIVLLRLIA